MTTMTAFILGIAAGLLICLIIHGIRRICDDQYLQGYQQAMDDSIRELRREIDQFEEMNFKTMSEEDDYEDRT